MNISILCLSGQSVVKHHGGNWCFISTFDHLEAKTTKGHSFSLSALFLLRLLCFPIQGILVRSRNRCVRQDYFIKCLFFLVKGRVFIYKSANSLPVDLDICCIKLTDFQTGIIEINLVESQNLLTKYKSVSAVVCEEKKLLVPLSETALLWSSSNQTVRNGTLACSYCRALNKVRHAALELKM